MCACKIHITYYNIVMCIYVNELHGGICETGENFTIYITLLCNVCNCDKFLKYTAKIQYHHYTSAAVAALHRLYSICSTYPFRFTVARTTALRANASLISM